MGWAFLCLLALAATGVTLLWIKCPGTVPPLRNAAGKPIAGSISERLTVEIGGVPQGMIIQSDDPSNPVLSCSLQGGQGMPEFLQTTHPTGLEQEFTFV